MMVTLLSLGLIAAAAQAPDPSPAIPVVARPADAPAPELAPGTRVRVKAEQKWSGRRRWIGQVVAADPERITVLPEGSQEPVVVRLSDLHTLEVSTGRRSRGLAALRVGGVTLGAGVALLGATGRLKRYGTLDDLAPTWLAFGGVATVTVLSSVAAALHPGDHWRRVDGAHTSLVLQPRPRGLGAAVALSF